MAKIVVTGGSGKAGRACVKDLLAHGYEVLNVDQVVPRRADVSDDSGGPDGFWGRRWMRWRRAMRWSMGWRAVVHLAAIPAPRQYTNAVTFEKNTPARTTFLRRRGGWGSRILCGRRARRCWGCRLTQPPPYAPVDEEYAGRPESAYSLGKLMGEEMAKQFCRWDPEVEDLRVAVFQCDGAAGLCGVCGV